MKSDIINQSEAVNLASADHTFTLRVDAIYCGAAGDVVARLKGDGADSTWKVQAGQYLHGEFTVVRRTGTTATNLLGVRTYRR